MSFSVVVSPEKRKEWEQDFFPNNARAWVQESADFAGIDLNAPVSNGWGRRLGGHTAPNINDDQDYEGKPTRDENGYSAQIFVRDITPLGERGELVVDYNETAIVWWQYAPLVPGVVTNFMNLDLTSDTNFEEGRLLGVLQEQKSIIGSMSDRAYGAGAANPISSFNYPVLTGFTPLGSPELGGALGTLLPWNSFFQNILPENADGIIVVLTTSCGQAFTYQINGPEAVLLGPGDLHDTAFDDTMKEVSLHTLVNEAVENGSFQGVPLDDKGCQYSIQVYASADMEAIYISNDPIYYTMGAILIFALTSLIFIVYDRLGTLE